MSFKRRTAPRKAKKQAPAQNKKKPGLGGMLGNVLGGGMQLANRLSTDGTTREPSKPKGGRDGGTFTGPTSDMGPTVHLPDELMPFKPTTMFA